MPPQSGPSGCRQDVVEKRLFLSLSRAQPREVSREWHYLSLARILSTLNPLTFLPRAFKNFFRDEEAAKIILDHVFPNRIQSSPAPLRPRSPVNMVTESVYHLPMARLKSTSRSISLPTVASSRAAEPWRASETTPICCSSSLRPASFIPTASESWLRLLVSAVHSYKRNTWWCK